jgi:hypothetical protein
MEFYELRNQVERVAEVIRGDFDFDVENGRELAQARATAILVLGQCLVEIVERLDGIEKALRERSSLSAEPGFMR